MIIVPVIIITIVIAVGIIVLTIVVIKPLLAIPITHSDLSLYCIGTTANDCLSIMGPILQLM